MVTFRELNQTEDEIKAYHQMRCNLYLKDLNHKYYERELYDEMQLILKGEGFYKNELLWKVFVAENLLGDLLGFVEISIYPELDYCETKPVGYVEAWYADQQYRKQGIGKGLIHHAEEWLKHRHIAILVSDAELWNELSHKAHTAVGFVKSHEEDGCFIYKKRLYH